MRIRVTSSRSWPKKVAGASRAASLPFCEDPFNEPVDTTLCVPLVDATNGVRGRARDPLESPLDVPLELACPSPSANMLAARLRLVWGRLSGVGVAVEELEASPGVRSSSSSEVPRCRRPRSWRVVRVVAARGARARVLVRRGVAEDKVGSGCWEAAGSFVVWAERTVLEGSWGSCVMDGSSEVDGV